jgi:hypothetical protein
MSQVNDRRNFCGRLSGNPSSRVAVLGAGRSGGMGRTSISVDATTDFQERCIGGFVNHRMIGLIGQHENRNAAMMTTVYFSWFLSRATLVCKNTAYK